MSINAATTTSSSSSVSSSASSSQVSSASNSDNAKKSASDSSFKEEMDKVSSTESKKDAKDVEKSDQKVNEVSDKSENSESKKDNAAVDSKDSLSVNDNEQLTLDGSIDYSRFASMSINDINSMLSNDLRQMINSASALQGLNSTSETGRAVGMMSFDFSNNISMTKGDADFFINLAQNNDVSMQNVVSQAQTMLNQGADVKEVKQNVQISQTLLNALNNARETNQPMRIDFDQNVSVILRIGKDGAISANFIPGDRAVEQYLRNNIENLKATFNENDLPYTDLSYSNRGSKQQKENRRNKQD